MAETKTFKTGDIVQLKSGGPKMTISSNTMDMVRDSIHCQWFAGSKLEDGYFPKESLTKVQEEVPSETRKS